MQKNVKTKMRRWGVRLLPTGIVMLVLGSVSQVLIFMESGGNNVVKAPERLVWSGIVVSLGIVATFAGALLLTAGKFRNPEEPPDPAGPGDAPHTSDSGQ